MSAGLYVGGVVLLVGVGVYLISIYEGVNDGMSDEAMIAEGALDDYECQASIDPKTGEVIADPACWDPMCCGWDNMKDKK
jgi:hypothetical protein